MPNLAADVVTRDDLSDYNCSVPSVPGASVPSVSVKSEPAKDALTTNTPIRNGCDRDHEERQGKAEQTNKIK